MKLAVKNFNDWVLSESQKLQGTPLEIVSSVQATRNLAEALLNKEGFTDDEKLCFFVLKESNTALWEWNDLNEGLLSKLKEVGAKAVKGGADFLKDVKTAIGKELTGLPEFFKALYGGIKNVVSYVKDFFVKIFKTVFGKPYDWVKTALGGNFAKFETTVKAAAEKEGVALGKEAKGVTDIVTGVPKLFSPKEIGDDLEKAVVKGDSEKIADEELALVEESINTSLIIAITNAVNLHTVEEIKEGIAAMSITDEKINEGGDHGHTKIPFVSTLSGIIEKMPPFSWLSSLAETFSKNANDYLNQLSGLMAKKGAIKSSTQFIVMGTLVGLGLEFLVKTGAKSAIAVLIPPLHHILLTIGGIATAICVVHVASTVIDGLKSDVKELDQAAAKVASH